MSYDTWKLASPLEGRSDDTADGMLGRSFYIPDDEVTITLDGYTIVDGEDEDGRYSVVEYDAWYVDWKGHRRMTTVTQDDLDEMIEVTSER